MFDRSLFDWGKNIPEPTAKLYLRHSDSIGLVRIVDDHVLQTIASQMKLQPQHGSVILSFQATDFVM